MLMKWTDLMPGDKVKINEVLKIKLHNRFGYEFIDETFKVFDVRTTNQNQLTVRIENELRWIDIFLDLDGKWDGEEFFELISVMES